MRRETFGISMTVGYSALITGCAGHTPLSIFNVKIVGWLTSKDASPRKGLDDAYLMLIRQANLDAMGGRAVATIHGLAAALKKSVGNCQLIRKTPTISPRGPMPLTDPVGMGLAVELLFHSLTAKPRIKGESHIQFDSMRRPRATFTSAWELSPIGIQEGSTFTLNTARVTVTSCPPNRVGLIG